MDQIRLKNHLPVEAIDMIIPINTALSNIQKIGDYTVVGIQIPSAWTAADISFKGATPTSQEIADPTTLFDLYDGNTELKYTPVASGLILVPPVLFIAPVYIQIRSGVTALPVNQAAARTIRVYVCPVMK